MSRRNKLKKFSELLSFPNVYENFDTIPPQLTGANGQLVDLIGQWNKQYFKTNYPITLELACGRGEYTLDLARKYPERNFIGVDIKGARIWQGAKIALEENLSNVAFLRTRIEVIASFFNPGEVDEIWITFPDPFLKKSKTRRRLTSAYFIEEYRKIIKKGGLLHLKTDEPVLYDFSLETFLADEKIKILYKNEDIYKEELLMEELETKTYYEKMHLKKGKKIKYIQFTINQ